MAIYHLSVQIIGRNSGRSSVAAAAYRAAEKLLNEYDGLEHDFTKKNWVEHTEIILPDNAPREYSDRSTLWNAVEMSEKSKDSQLCREYEIALPVELTKEQQIELAERFARESLVSQGMIADIAIHNPPVMNDRHQPIDQDGIPTKDREKMQFRNPHAHIMATVRPMDENGKWMTKSKTEYLCIKDGEEKGFTAEEFKQAKEDGWEKQYKYVDGKNRIWLPAEEGQARGLERVNRSPKTTPYGRKNEVIEYWNSKDRVLEWRQNWENIVNERLRSLSLDVRIDCRSYADQGRTDEMPTMHMGPAAVNMDRRAERERREGVPEAALTYSDIGEINREIKEHNKLVREIKAAVEKVAREAKELAEKMVKKLEGIRARIIGNKYQESVLMDKKKKIEAKLDPERERYDKYKTELIHIRREDKKASQKLEKLQAELDECTVLQFRKKKDLQEQMDEICQGIEARKEYLESFAEMTGFETAEKYEEAKEDIKKRTAVVKKIEDTLDRIHTVNEELKEEYKAEKQAAESMEHKELLGNFRSWFEDLIREKLIQKYDKTRFDEKLYKEAIKSTDSMIDDVHEESRSREKTRARHH